MADRKFETFVEKVDDKEVTFKVYEPIIDDYKEAAKARNIAFIEALNSKATLRGQVNTLLRSRGQWDDEREAQYKDYTQQLLAKDLKLKKGGIKLVEGKKLALEMRDLRNKLTSLLTDKSNLDNMTAEGQADNAHFNSLLVTCLVYNNEKGEEVRYFANLDEYVVRGNTEIANTAAQKLMNMLYTVGESGQKVLPENQFLIKYKFVNEALKLINKDGKLIDDEGRLIDKDGRFINNEGKYVDKFGNEVDDKGDYVVNATPFLDDDGNQVLT